MKGAPAYSVIAIFVLAGYTLTGYPVSVFAQDDQNETTPTEIDGAEQETATNATSSDVADIPAVSLSVAEQAANPTDSYKREELLSDKVFSDFVIGPGRFQLEIAPGESRTVEMTVTNRMGIPKRFSFTTEDMSGTDDPNESLVLLGDEVGPYTIKDYISVPHRSFYLAHGERARVPVTVSIPADAEPGGFYGSILTEIVSDDVTRSVEEGQAAPGSKLISRIGTLFFVTTPGEVERETNLLDFSALNNQRFFTSGPINFNIVTENTGSVHVTPYGEVRVYNTLGTEVGYVELQPWYVLPKSIRNKEITWEREFLVGQYKAVAKIDRGYGGIVDEVSYTFWVVPLEIMAAVFAGFFVLFILIRFFFSRFEFRRKGN